ncbi:MAG: hypothetical protein M1548_09285 [Actinobacteria bacterium]|nr:hypothetical protein [Actinomycetota bacterium]
MRRLQEKYSPEGPEQLLQHYIVPRSYQKLDFVERKQLAALISQYMVPLPDRVAREMGVQVTEKIWRLMDSSVYSEHTGLAHLVGEEEQHTFLA